MGELALQEITCENTTLLHGVYADSTNHDYFVILSSEYEVFYFTSSCRKRKYMLEKVVQGYAQTHPIPQRKKACITNILKLYIPNLLPLQVPAAVSSR